MTIRQVDLRNYYGRFIDDDEPEEGFPRLIRFGWEATLLVRTLIIHRLCVRLSAPDSIRTNYRL